MHLRVSAFADSVVVVGLGGCDGGCFPGAVRGFPAGKRGVFLLGRLTAHPGRGIRIRRLGGTRAGEVRVTRFLRNARVTVEEMVSTASARTAERCVGRDVLAIQDTTVVRSQGGGGLYLHVVVAVDAADGALLGLIHAEFLKRESGASASRTKRPIEDKQSRRWLDGARKAADVCAGAASVTVIADRESDIHEAFARRPAGVDLVIRAAQDRGLEDGGRLFASIGTAAVAARSRVMLPAQPGRRARTAELEVRRQAVRLAARRADPAVALTLVDVRESAPPAGDAPVHWRLLTSLPVASGEDAKAVAALYRRRWAIEQLFRTLKTRGFDIEDLLVEEEAPRMRLVTAALVAAVTVQQMVHARDGRPADGPEASPRPIEDILEPDDIPLMEAMSAGLEGRTQRQKNPHPPRTLAYAAWVCARLGGWTGYYGKPGPIVILQGWKQFQATRAGLTLLKRQRDV